MRPLKESHSVQLTAAQNASPVHQFTAAGRSYQSAVSSLLVGLQSVLVAYLTWVWMGDRVRPRQTSGLVLGFLEILVVVYLGGRELGSMEFRWQAMVYNVISLLAISAGTL